MTTKTLPPMTRKEWEALPDVVKYFHDWPRAKKPLTIAVKDALKQKAGKDEQQK